MLPPKAGASLCRAVMAVPSVCKQEVPKQDTCDDEQDPKQQRQPRVYYRAHLLRPLPRCAGQEADQFFDAPDMMHRARFHRWRHARG